MKIRLEVLPYVYNRVSSACVCAGAKMLYYLDATKQEEAVSLATGIPSDILGTQHEVSSFPAIYPSALSSKYSPSRPVTSRS